MVTLRARIPWLLVVLLAPAAVAQAPAPPTSSIALLGLPADGTVAAANATLYEEDLQVHLVLANVVCPQPATAIVTLKVETGGNATANRTTQTLTFTIPAGAYTEGSPYSDDMPAEVRLSRAAEADLVPVQVTASLPADGDRFGCAGTGGVPAADRVAGFSVRFEKAPPAPTAPAPTTKMPGLGAVALVGALVLGLALTRRPERP